MKFKQFSALNTGLMYFSLWIFNRVKIRVFLACSSVLGLPLFSRKMSLSHFLLCFLTGVSFFISSSSVDSHHTLTCPVQPVLIACVCLSSSYISSYHVSIYKHITEHLGHSIQYIHQSSIVWFCFHHMKHIEKLSLIANILVVVDGNTVEIWLLFLYILNIWIFQKLFIYTAGWIFVLDCIYVLPIACL